MITYQDNSLIPYETWKQLRNNSLGASEVGPVVYGSKWTSNLEIFYRKIGLGKDTVENIRMFLGTATEVVNERCWSFYDGNEESVVRNARNNTPVKKSIDLKVTAFNSKFPHLSVTVDREIQDFGKYAGKGKGALEMKNTTSMAMKSYENGLPTDNVLQIVTQMMVHEYGYGNLFYFIDNNRFEEYELLRSSTKKMEDLVLNVTTPFWENVKKAKILVNKLFEAKRTFNMKLAYDIEHEIQLLEPPAQNTSGYLNFLTDRYKDRIAKVGYIKGSDDDYTIAKKHKEAIKKAKKIEEERRDLEIKLKLILKENNCLDFGTKGKLTYYPTVNGNRLLKNNVK